jgi:hypothetical protein
LKRGFVVAQFALGFVVAGACSGLAMAELTPNAGAKAATIR